MKDCGNCWAIRYIGILSNERHTITLNYPAAVNQTLQILVEIEGYQAFPERKGLLSPVHLNTTDLKYWTMWAFGFDKIEGLQNRISALPSRRDRPSGKQTASLFRSTFVAPENLEETLDSFLDVSRFGRGMLFLNHRLLGKFNSLGPQQSLYVPSCFIKPYPFANQLTVLELSRRAAKLKLRNHGNSRRNIGKQNGASSIRPGFVILVLGSSVVLL